MAKQLSLFIYVVWVGVVASCPHVVYAQMAAEQVAGNDARPWLSYLDALSETEDYENTSWEDYEELFNEYAEHPMNINTATREDLELLPFLSERQVEDILAYLYHYGEMKSLGELAMISSIDWYQRQLLGCFVYAGEVKQRSFPSLKHILRYGKQEWVGSVKIPFYQRAGDNNGYMGYPYKHWQRYQLRRGDYVKMGLVGSQDAGEPFFDGKNTAGYDFYSFYLQIRKWGRIKNLTLGRYRLREGMGLILNCDFGMGKLSMLSSLGRMGPTIRTHSSRSAANYLQGFAATVNVAKGLDVTGFLSYRPIDATVKNGGISTIVTTGLHRTSQEIAKQKVASAFLGGGNLHYTYHGFHLAATALYHSYSLPLAPNTSVLYKRFAPVGSAFWNASIDYGYLSHRFTWQGETATGSSGAIATVNSASYLFSERFSLLALYRFYPYRYYALYGNSFSAGTSVQDESGFYLGSRFTPSRHWMIEAYADVAYFAWPKYQLPAGTYAVDCVGNVIYHPSEAISIGVRYRYKQKQAAAHRMRFYFSTVRKIWTSKTQIDAILQPNSRGYMVNESYGCHWRSWRLQGFMGYFQTTDYNSRIYAYEPSMLYTMSYASYYGQGIRYSLLVKAELGKHCVGACKVGTTNYFDRNHISSGLQQINKSSQTDLEIQLKLKW